VAGVAALIWASHPQWNASQVRQRLREITWDLGNPGKDNYYGYGLVDGILAIHHCIDIPITPADSSHTSGWGDYYAEADSAAASYRLEVGTTLMNGSDSYAIATLKKNFVPKYGIANPTFYFAFQDKGYMDAHRASYAYTDLNAFLRLWCNGIELSQYNPVIHCVSDSYCSTDCFHEVTWTYSGDLLVGNTYTIEYGFTSYEHEAWSDFHAGDKEIKANWLLLSYIYRSSDVNGDGIVDIFDLSW